MMIAKRQNSTSCPLFQRREGRVRFRFFRPRRPSDLNRNTRHKPPQPREQRFKGPAHPDLSGCLQQTKKPS